MLISEERGRPEKRGHLPDKAEMCVPRSHGCWEDQRDSKSVGSPQKFPVLPAFSCACSVEASLGFKVLRALASTHYDFAEVRERTESSCLSLPWKPKVSITLPSRGSSPFVLKDFPPASPAPSAPAVGLHFPG